MEVARLLRVLLADGVTAAAAMPRAADARDADAATATEAAWPALAARAADLGAEGLLHAAVRRAGLSDRMPVAVRDRLRRVHAGAAAKNLELVAEAERVLAALARAGVMAAPMKGAALFREGIVRDLGTRPTTDLDLATRRSDRRRALEVLGDLGYRASRTESSWKHLTPMRRADLAIELHEVAYWSGRSRAVFGAEHLLVADDAVRLGRLWALQVHHLVLGSPPDAALLVRTLADVASFADRARTDARLVHAAQVAGREAGVDREMSACDAIVAEARGTARVLVGLEHDAAVARELLRPMSDERVEDARLNVLVHFMRTAHRQPLSISAATMATLLFPPEGAGEAGVTARALRPFELGARVIGALPRALRALVRR